MSKVNYNLKAFHMKIFLTSLIFCTFSGFHDYVAPFLPSFLHDLGYTMTEVGFIGYILNVLVFILNSALLFIILYSFCRRGFMEDIASITISLITGTIVGYWIGGLLGLLMSPPRFQSPSLFTLSLIMSEFGACSPPT